MLLDIIHDYNHPSVSSKLQKLMSIMALIQILQSLAHMLDVWFFMKVIKSSVPQTPKIWLDGTT